MALTVSNRSAEMQAKLGPPGRVVAKSSKCARNGVVGDYSREVAIYSGGSIPIRSFTASRIFCLHPR